MRLVKVGILTLIALCPCVCIAKQHDLDFSAEIDSIQNPVQLPADALTLLTSDKEDFRDGPPQHLRCSNREEYPSQGEEPREQILCTTLPLSSSSSGKDYLVIGVGTLRGAHIVPFWIIHQDSKGAKLLFKDRSDDLLILQSRHGGYRELEVTRVFQAGATIQTDKFRYDGERYVRFSSREDHN